MKKETLAKIKELVNFDSNLQSVEIKDNITIILHNDFILTIDEIKEYYSFQIIINRSDIEFYKMVYIIELKYILDELIKNNVSGYLPCFDGFYNSYLEFDDDSTIYNINEDRQEKNLDDIENYHDIVDIDYKRYRIDISKIAVDVIEKELIDLQLIQSIEFETLYSPKEYNFSTDSVNVIYSISDDNKKMILAYVLNNIIEFAQYIHDNFTSRSGFISFYSNDFNTWLKELKSWEFEKISTQVSVILEFICLNENEQNSYTDKIMDEFSSNNCFDFYINNYSELIEENEIKKEV